MVRYLRAANVKDGVLDLASVHQMTFSPQEQAVFSLKPAMSWSPKEAAVLEVSGQQVYGAERLMVLSASRTLC